MPRSVINQKNLRRMMGADMAIQYKKIIKKILGPDAEKNGFKSGHLGPAGISKRTLACYEKEYDDGYTLSFDIDLDTFFDKLELSACGIFEERSFDSSDTESFKKVIFEFAEILRDKGYPLMEEAARKEAARPKFTAEEQLYLLNNYERLAEDFCKEKQVDSGMSFMDKLCLIKEMVESSRELPFEEVREKLIEIAAFYAVALLGWEKVNSYLVNSGGRYLTVSGALRGTIAPLESILNIWLNEDDIDVIKSDCKSVLQQEQYNSLEWKF
jgi:hypothetical protein